MTRRQGVCRNWSLFHSHGREVSVYIFMVYSIIYSIDKPSLQIMSQSRLHCIPLPCPIMKASHTYERKEMSVETLHVLFHAISECPNYVSYPVS